MIIGRAHVLLKDDRTDLRIKENERLYWQIKYKQREGEARVRNISASGMLMETDTAFDPKEECVLSFDTDLGEENYIPQVGRLVWQKKNRFSRSKYSCGIKFLDADDQVLGRMRQRVQKGVDRFLKKRRFTTIVGAAVSIAFVGLIGFVIWLSSGIYQDITQTNQKIFNISSQQAVLTQSYQQLYRASEMNLVDKTEKLNIAGEIIREDKVALALFSKELEATGALLNRTEEILTEVNGRNVELSNEILALQAQVEAQIAKEQSNAAVANVELSMAEYRLKLRSIKNQMRQLKDKERAARVAAQTEIDHQKQLLGNNGFFVREGQIVQVNEDLYRRIDANKSPASVAAQANRKVEIDVTFFDNL